MKWTLLAVGVAYAVIGLSVRMSGQGQPPPPQPPPPSQSQPPRQPPIPGLAGVSTYDSCIVVKPYPACQVFEFDEYQKLIKAKAISDAQHRYTYSGMSPVPVTKLPPGHIYWSTTSGDLVEAKVGPGVWVDMANDPANPIVRAVCTAK